MNTTIIQKTATQCGVLSGSALFAVFAMLSTFFVTVGNVNSFHFVNGRLQPLEVFEQKTSSYYKNPYQTWN